MIDSNLTTGALLTKVSLHLLWHCIIFLCGTKQKLKLLTNCMTQQGFNGKALTTHHDIAANKIKTKYL